MLYTAIKRNRVYRSQSTIPFPKGNPIGKGELLFLCEPNREASYAFIAQPKYDLDMSRFLRYTTDTRYKGRIGTKTLNKMMRKELMQEYEATPAAKRVKFIPPNMVEQVVKMKYNLIYDFGMWNELFFSYRRKTVTPDVLCETYIDFLLTYFNKPEFKEYHKTLVLEPKKWLESNPQHAVGITKAFLNDPVSILMACIRRYPHLLDKIKNVDIYMVDAEGGDMVLLDVTTLNPKTFSKFTQSLAKMGCLKFAEVETQASTSDGDLEDKAIKKIETSKAIKDEDKQKEVQALKAVVTTSATDDAVDVPETIVKPVTPPPTNTADAKPKKLTKNEQAEQDVIDFLMDLDEDESKPRKDKTPSPSTSDTPSGNQAFDYDSDISGDSESSINETPDPELEEDIDREVEAAMDEAPDDASPEEIEEIAENRVKRNVMIQRFKPDFDEKTTRRIHELMEMQDTILDQSIEDMKAKEIPKSDLNNYVRTANQSIAKPKAKNFYKGYNENLFEKDVDRCVAALSRADYPLFIQSKSVEDTSDTMNYKRTYTYNMLDKDGHKHTIVFDLPIFIDDRYIYLGGNRKVIQNQMFVLPLLKSGPDEVQIVTLYRKIIMNRKGYRVDVRSELIKKYILSDAGIRAFHVQIGDALMKNRGYDTTLDYDNLAKNITSCQVGGIKFIFNAPMLMEEINKLRAADNLKPLDSNYNKNGLLVGYVKSTHEPVYATERAGQSVNDLIFDHMSPEHKQALTKFTVSSKALSYVYAKIYMRTIPIVMFMGYCEGLTSILNKMKATYTVVEPGTRYNILEQSAIKFSDKWMIWNHHPLHVSLILNGMSQFETENFKMEEADGKGFWTMFAGKYYKSDKEIQVLDQFKDLMIDPISADILRDMNLPTDLVSLIVAGCIMMNNSQYQNVTEPKNFRIRSNEIFAQFIYEAVTDAYFEYRRSIYKKTPKKVSVQQNLVFRKIYGGKNKRTGMKDNACSMIEDSSTLNPVLELEKKDTISFRGPSGINLDRAYNLSKRQFNPGMTGTIAISTSPDKNVGVARELTMDPNITSLRGYIGPHDDEAIEEMSGAQLFGAAELLSPPGASHDDAQRTSMAYKQSKYMVMTSGSSPVLMGNKVEAALPYYMSRDFVVTAKQNGKVVEIANDMVVVEYKDGTHDSFSLAPTENKNSAGGFYVETKFQTSLEVGSTFKEGEVIAYDPNAFTKNKNDRSASMNIGVLCKVAIAPTHDIYEDSAPITTALSKKLSTTMVNESRAVLSAQATIKMMHKVGDHIEAGDALIEYDNTKEDPELSRLWDDMQSMYGEELSENVIQSVRSEHSGEIADIRIYSAVPLEDLSESLRPVVRGYWKKIEAKNKMLEKYRNPNDPAMIPAGTQIKEIAGPTEAKFGKILGETVNDGVLICFFVKHSDPVKKGDKVTAYTALKGIVSNVIDPGFEPKSEFRLDEDVDCMIAPSAILARKTPSILFSMWGNKILIELKRKLKSIYFEEKYH